MKKKNLIALAGMALLASGGVLACAPTITGPEQEADVFKNARFYYDTSVEAYNISVEIPLTGEVTSLSSGRTTAEEGQYINRNGVLTISSEFLSTLNAGERTIRATTEEGNVDIDAYIVHKVIRTAQEFQDINERLDGYYILGNDIDLSSIDNFEPLGFYFSETSLANDYFHGILDGNGYTVKNAKVYYSDSVATNYNVYTNTGSTRFESDAHKAGDNIGLFQVIGSAGVVRHVNFSNIDVRGRTIVGAIAGNCMGTVYDCYIDSQCDVEMSTHYYDDDCNMGGAFGIVAGSGTVYNVISEIDHLTLGATSTTSVNYNGTSISIENGVYLDFGDTYVGETGNGWDHPASGEAINEPWWRFAGVDKPDSPTDSNGSATNGQYAFAGKCWGSISDCVSRSFNIVPMNGTAREANFSQTHLAENKPTSGDSDLGTITNCDVYTSNEMKQASTYSAFSTDVWNIADGSIPTLKTNYIIETKLPEEAA